MQKKINTNNNREIYKFNLVEFVNLFYKRQGKSIEFTKQGNSYVCICPFRSEKTSSFSIKQLEHNGEWIFKCFGCGVTGNILSFVTKQTGLSVKEALKLIGTITGIKTITKKIKKEEKEFFELRRVSCIRYRTTLKEDMKASKESGINEDSVEYLKYRGLYDNDILNTFSIGVTPPDEWEYTKVADVGNRIAFPLDKMEYGSKDIVAFCYRHYLDYIDPKKLRENNKWRKDNKKKCIPKYTMTFNSNKYEVDGIAGYYGDIYIKDNYIYNISRSLEYIRQEKEVIVVEGILDTIALYKCGIKNVVSTLTCKMSEYVIDYISNITDVITIWYDFDEAGQEDLQKIIRGFTKNNCIVYVYIPEFKGDPDEVSKKLNYNGDKLKEMIKNYRIEGWEFLITKLIGPVKVKIKNVKRNALRQVKLLLDSVDEDIRKEILEETKKELERY